MTIANHVVDGDASWRPFTKSFSREGVDEARRQAASKHERALVEAAYRVLSEDADKMGFTYSGFALTSLPHKPQPDVFWRREGHNITLLLESGRDRTGKPVGLPYGSYARFILLFLQSEAVKTGSREIELGRSMRVWLGTIDGSEGAYGIAFPDLPGCAAMGATMDNAMAAASEALGDWITTVEANGHAIPVARTAEQLLPDPEIAEAVRDGSILTCILVVRSSGKPVRANLSLDKAVVTAIDAAAARRGVTRSAMVEIIARQQLPEMA